MSEKLLFPISEDRAEYAALHEHFAYSALKRWATWVQENMPGQMIRNRRWHTLGDTGEGTSYAARFHHIGTTLFTTDTQTVNIAPADASLPLVSVRGRQHAIKHTLGQRPVVGEWDYLAGPLGLAWVSKVSGSGQYSLVATDRTFSTNHHPAIADVRVEPGGAPEIDVPLLKAHLLAAHACIASSMLQMAATAA